MSFARLTKNIQNRSLILKSSKNKRAKDKLFYNLSGESLLINNLVNLTLFSFPINLITHLVCLMEEDSTQDLTIRFSEEEVRITLLAQSVQIRSQVLIPADRLAQDSIQSIHLEAQVQMKSLEISWDLTSLESPQVEIKVDSTRVDFYEKQFDLKCLLHILLFLQKYLFVSNLIFNVNPARKKDFIQTQV